eukprot:TRINITY_DN26078_c0_g1_i1.p1 TRINITY_DN26078_c0_g1~~TRINITY_DN26078_c0_g1_i1.p1  ORF type:complete len:271 (-),score=56.87 TRINITY_DN26078_c0_g1_i1:706-1518(-)
MAAPSYVAAWPAAHIIRQLRGLPKKTIKYKGAEPQKTAAVLVPLCLDEKRRPSVLFCVRSAKLRSHAGEICFPGGRSEPNDADAADTALREASEEVGLCRSNIQILGEMPPVLSKGMIPVTPVVGCLQGDFQPSALVLNKTEVEAVFTLPLEHLLRKDVLVWHRYVSPREEIPTSVPAFRIPPEQLSQLPRAVEGQARPPSAPEDEVSVWGLTGFMLHRFLFDILKLEQRPAGDSARSTSTLSPAVSEAQSNVHAAKPAAVAAASSSSKL